MTREEAEGRAAELNREHPGRATQRWFARRSGEDWQVARVSLPPGMRLDPLKAGVESRPKPSPAPDPRAAPHQNVPGY